MRKISKLIYSNKLFACILLILQIIILSVGYMWLTDYRYYIVGTETLLKTLIIIYEINREDSSDFKVTWLMVIAVLPVFGVLLYIYLHLGTMLGDMRKRQSIVRKESSKYLVQSEAVIEELCEKDAYVGGLAKYLRKNGGSPVYKNTEVKYYSLGDGMFEDMKIELEKAEKFIFLEFFIINPRGRMWSEILEILKRKAAEGVEVRMMFDGMGCMTTLPRAYTELMASFNINCRIFSPIQPLLSSYQNNRDHRKIMVIDGCKAFSGGINLADEYANFVERFGHWKDTGIFVEGEAVAGFTGMFLEMWNLENTDEEDDYGKYINASEAFAKETKGYVIPYGDSPLDNEYVGKRVYVDSINNATRYINIMTPYLVLDQELLDALKYAVCRGVDVRIMMPHIPDKKSAFWLARTYYPQLIKAGVKIYEYTPGFVHAKTLVADDVRAVVGTINLDFRSLYLHYECAAYLYEVPAIAEIKKDYDETLTKCIHITMQEYKKFPLYIKFIGRVIRLFAPLF